VSTDAGDSWTQTKNGPQDHYYYGIQAFNDDRTCFASGFSDPPQSGLYTVTKDGGKTWSNDDLYLSGDWLMQVEFSAPKFSTGIIAAMSGKQFAIAQRNVKTGAFALKTVQGPSSPSPGWFAQFPFPYTGTNANITGIRWCGTANSGLTWECKAGVDPDGDGGLFQDGSFALVGGGLISPNVSGWIHVSNNGGNTWGNRVNFPYPIRAVTCISAKLCLASGGNFFTGVGGVYISTDGGVKWTEDLNAGVELGALSVVGGNTVYVAGSSHLNGGNFYRKTYY
jgi:photosystem II stability/assembly factor-like uncharacterized protein